jgi:hypothetical protein
MVHGPVMGVILPSFTFVLFLPPSLPLPSYPHRAEDCLPLFLALPVLRSFRCLVHSFSLARPGCPLLLSSPIHSFAFSRRRALVRPTSAEQLGIRGGTTKETEKKEKHSLRNIFDSLAGLLVSQQCDRRKRQSSKRNVDIRLADIYVRFFPRSAILEHSS